MKRKITIKKEYNNIRSFIKLLPGVMDTEGTYIYGGRRNLIKKFTAPDGTVVNVKRYKIPQGINKLVYSLGIRRPKGERAYEYATRLLQLGIPTPEAIAYIEQRHLGLLAESFLITRQCPYTHLLYEMGNASKEQYMPMAKALAHFAYDMHSKGVLHLDFSPGNILWEYDHDGNIIFSIVDINRMHFGTITQKQACCSFSRLWGPKEFIVSIVSEYAQLAGYDVSSSTSICLEERRRFWTRYQRKREIEFNLEL